jgi:hypothetical protein
MDKKQQIEEIAGTICNTCKERFEISKKCKNVIEPCLAAYAHSEAIYNAGYRKIDDNCAVITKSELKEYKRQAVKEFAERLKEHTILYNGINVKYEAITADIIDELLKEYER